jgi:cyclophilin family peptidyl-prolyl cis-trans isomerase
MTKNILISLVLVCTVSVCGYYLFRDKKVETSDSFNSALSGQENNSQTASANVASTTSDTKPVVNNSDNKKTHMITIDTNYGKIVIETYDADAPNTVKNFVTLADKGFYNGLTFHRVIKGFMIQGGDPNGTGTGGPGYQFADELNPNTPSYKAGYKKGVVAMANAGPNTNGSQFFIMTADYPLPNLYTIFGKVVSGQDVVDTIANVKTNPNDKPISPVTMMKVSVN